MRDDVALRLPTAVPAPGIVHLWMLDLDADATSIEAMKATLDAGERARGDRLRTEQLRSRFVVAHGAVRQLLARYLDVPAAAVTLEQSALGKPSVKDQPLVFNLSHSGGLAVCAVAAQGRLGVDIEAVRAMPEAGALVRGNFSDAEIAEFFQLPRERRTRAFLTAWTRKEAFVKATGEGLQLALDSFDVSVATSEARLTRVPGAQPLDRWSMHGFEPLPGYVGTLAIDQPIERVMRFAWRVCPPASGHHTPFTAARA